jgi:hypothetical protein
MKKATLRCEAQRLTLLLVVQMGWLGETKVFGHHGGIGVNPAGDGHL